jgi:hypothetical protein
MMYIEKVVWEVVVVVLFENTNGFERSEEINIQIIKIRPMSGMFNATRQVIESSSIYHGRCNSCDVRSNSNCII